MLESVVVGIFEGSYTKYTTTSRSPNMSSYCKHPCPTFRVFRRPLDVVFSRTRCASSLLRLSTTPNVCLFFGIFNSLKGPYYANVLPIHGNALVSFTNAQTASRRCRKLILEEPHMVCFNGCLPTASLEGLNPFRTISLCGLGKRGFPCFDHASGEVRASVICDPGELDARLPSAFVV